MPTRSREAAPPRAADLDVRQRLVEALTHGRYISKRKAEEVAFHLTDWSDELMRLRTALNSTPFEPRQTQDAIIDFLVHAPAHVAAAARIVLDLPVGDVFALGATVGSGRARRAGSGPQTRKSISTRPASTARTDRKKIKG